MDNIVMKVFNHEHVQSIISEHPDFPTQIDGIKCRHCGRKFKEDADLMIDHLQFRHNLEFKEIIN